MSHPHCIEVSGIVADIFAHRFVVLQPNGTRLLADLTPHGIGSFSLYEGQNVRLTGEMKPSELKVSSIANEGGLPVIIRHPDKNAPDANPDVAANALKAAGFTLVDAPRRKPKHFECLTRKDGIAFECHVAFDGTIRKEKRVEVDDAKWSSLLSPTS